MQKSADIMEIGGNSRPLLIGHRGASGHAPENTLSSFRLALDTGCDAVEFDIQQTADGQIVVLHDETLERTTDGEGFVRDRTLAEIKALDAGSWFSEGFRGERVPTLSEALGAIAGKGIAVIEIKHGSDIYPDIEKRLASVVNSNALWRRCSMAISFDPNALQNLMEWDGGIHVGLLTADPPEDYLDIAEEMGIKAIFPRWEKLRDESVRQVHMRGRAVHPWVMDKEEDIARVLSWGPDSISSNFPDRAAEVMKRF